MGRLVMTGPFGQIIPIVCSKWDSHNINHTGTMYPNKFVGLGL